MRGLVRAVVLALLPVSVVASCAGGDRAGGHEASETSESAPSAAVTREILAHLDDVPGAEDRRLTLVRYTIAPGAELAPHVHPGVQMASIVSGTLSYRVLSGTAVIHRRTDEPGVGAIVDTLVGPADTQLGVGDAVVEDATMLHFGANRTSDPVVIVAALLTERGAELAVPLPEP